MDNPIIAFSEIREKEGFSVQEKQAMFYRRNPNYSLFLLTQLTIITEILFLMKETELNTWGII